MRARPRKRRRPAPAEKSTRLKNYAGWTFVILFVSAVIALYLWRMDPRNQTKPVAAHSTPRIEGRCAVDAKTGMVWGRIVRLGTMRGHMDWYVVQTLDDRGLVEKHVTRVRVVPCEDVTGPKALDYGRPAT